MALELSYKQKQELMPYIYYYCKRQCFVAYIPFDIKYNLNMLPYCVSVKRLWVLLELNCCGEDSCCYIPNSVYQTDQTGFEIEINGCCNIAKLYNTISYIQTKMEEKIEDVLINKDLDDVKIEIMVDDDDDDDRSI